MRLPIASPPSARRLLLLVALLIPTVSAAQDQRPIRGYVIDVRGAVINLGQDAEVASQRGLGPAQLPPWGWSGIDVGGHVYLLRWRAVTFGLGASVQLTSASRSPGKDDPDPAGPTVKSSFVAISPQLSLNFGHRDGWSYLSGGLGTSRLTVYAEPNTQGKQRRAETINYGGGARWFLNPHLAFSLDMRIFAISPLTQNGNQPGSPRMNRYAFNVGVSFR